MNKNVLDQSLRKHANSFGQTSIINICNTILRQSLFAA